MTRIVWVTGIALAAFTFTGCGSTSTEQKPVSTSATPSSTAVPEPSHKVVPPGGVYWNPVTQQPEEKPTEIVLTPADAGDMLVDITWDSWTQQQATGKAVSATKDCVPDCATGGTSRRDVTLVFQAPQSLPDDSGWWQFTKLVITGSDGKSETIDMPMTAQ
ncbi:hypothetical protein BKG83_16105 [Mycobacteroides chelonae]|uniref:hypothetical protein n=1 Tax=Mycobacteroides chelonae TaxID=1774 RepID=UPI0008A86488|nr:hypothetical protein [Mycobacteroides chelonae]OHU55739.1 hypothetical protein BKG83_16105 [Mycobacteroides chelonae]PKQ58150.1 hypothetical protein B5566_09540 [Mycobacterium sp. MHSD3]